MRDLGFDENKRTTDPRSELYKKQKATFWAQKEDKSVIRCTEGSTNFLKVFSESEIRAKLFTKSADQYIYPSPRGFPLTDHEVHFTI